MAAKCPAGKDKYLQTLKDVLWNYCRAFASRLCCVLRETVTAEWLLFQCCHLWSSAAGRNSTASPTGPASRNAGDATETRTARTGATRKTARAPRGCATPRPNLPAKTQVGNTEHTGVWGEGYVWSAGSKLIVDAWWLLRGPEISSRTSQMKSDIRKHFHTVDFHTPLLNWHWQFWVARGLKKSDPEAWKLNRARIWAPVRKFCIIRPRQTLESQRRSGLAELIWPWRTVMHSNRQGAKSADFILRYMGRYAATCAESKTDFPRFETLCGGYIMENEQSSQAIMNFASKLNTVVWSLNVARGVYFHEQMTETIPQPSLLKREWTYLAELTLWSFARVLGEEESISVVFLNICLRVSVMNYAAKWLSSLSPALSGGL